MALEQVKDENVSDLPYHNKQTEKIHEERSKPVGGRGVLVKLDGGDLGRGYVKPEVTTEEHAAAE